MTYPGLRDSEELVFNTANSMLLNFTIFFSLVVAGITSIFVALKVLKIRVMDHPNNRSSHDFSTPTSGGLGVMAGVAIPLIVVVFTNGYGVEKTAFLMFFLLALLVVLLGGYDDFRALPAKIKFPILAVLALAATVVIYPVQTFFLDHSHITVPLIAGFAGTALWVFVLCNAANFMDGSDALLASSAMVGGAALALLALDAGNGLVVLMVLALIVALAGFLPLNIPPARMFMGDAGALFIGFWLAGLSIFYVHDGPPAGLYAVVIIFMPWLSDVLLTMAWRLKKHYPLLKAHNDHLYQLALQRGMSHGMVALMLAFQTALCGGLAWVFRTSATSALLALAAVASLAIIGHWWARVAFAASSEASET